VRVYERNHERWEIELRDAQVVTRHAVNGVVEESSTAHASPLRAKWEADKLCSRLGAQGWSRADATDAPLAQADLEAALAANPDDRDAYLVYADWLSERGDDWGQLITIQHAMEQLPRFGSSERRHELARIEAELMFRLGAHLWGTLGETVHDEATQRYLSDLVEATWQCGFLRGVHLGSMRHATFRTIADVLPELPIARLLRSITLVDDEWFADTLERVVVRRWPLLAAFDIGSHRTRLDAARVVPILANAPALTTLTVWNTTNTDVLCQAIARSSIVSQLREIDLRNGQVGARGVAALSTAKLEALQSLELATTSSDARAKLQHLAPKVRIRVDE
jgi:uncharacterized protein (TIGR02996 family)